MNPFEEFVTTLAIDVTTYTALTFKYNLSVDISADILASQLTKFVANFSDVSGVWFATCGEHRQGVNEVPHVHVSVVVPSWKPTDTNMSRLRGKFVHYKDISQRATQIKTVEDLENTLKYPWKEGLEIRIPKIKGCVSCTTLPQPVIEYLKVSAKAMFESHLANRHKRERASEKSKTLLQELESLIGNREFANYEEYVAYISQAYLEPLTPEEYPDFSNLKKAIQKLAVHRKIVSYSKFFL